MSCEQPLGGLEIGAWLVDPAVDEISRDGVSTKLEPRTMRLLMRLAESAGQVVSSQQLLDDVWAGVVVGPASVYQAVSQLRKLLGDTDTNPSYIVTVPRKGYRLVAPVHIVPEPLQGGIQPALPVQLALPSGLVVPEQVRSGRPWRMAAATAIAALLIAAAALLSFFVAGNPDGAKPRAQSLVVLPFVDLTADQSNQVFCDGLTEELSSWLSQLPSLRVVARTSAFALRGRNEDVRALARTVSATHVLEGSVRRSGDQIRVTAQLVDGRDGYQAWSSTFSMPLTDVIGIQSEIARAVATALELRLTDRTSDRLAVRSSVDPAASNLYWAGLESFRRRTSQDNRRAIDLYQQAITLDPSFIQAHAALARAYLNEHVLASRPLAEVARQVEPVLTSVLGLDPDFSEAYALRGALRFDQGRQAEAEADLNHALELNPNDAQAHSDLGRVFESRGDPRHAVDSFARAAELDPLDFMRHVDRCISLHDQGRVQEAGVACLRAQELAPGSSWPARALGWLAFAQGQLDEALEWNGKALQKTPTDLGLYDERAEYFLQLGLTQEVRDTYDRAAELSSDGTRFSLQLASLLPGGQGVAALRSFEQSGVAAFPDPDELFDLARAYLRAGDAVSAGRILDRAMASPDFQRQRLFSPAEIRWGHSNALLAAAVALQLGNEPAARQWLTAFSAVLDTLEQNGQRGSSFEALRAEALALQDDGDAAIRALQRAVDLGWRDSWSAQHDPQWSALRARPDFQRLLQSIEQSNAAARARLQQHSAE